MAREFLGLSRHKASYAGVLTSLPTFESSSFSIGEVFAL